MEITILSEIEKAVVREIKRMVRDKAEILPLNGEIDIRHSAHDENADMPTISAAITLGEISQSAMDVFRADIKIDIIVIATHGLEHDKRINELYPILAAVLFRLTGLTLRSEDGKELPVSAISPNGRFGQIHEDEHQLAYKITFETGFEFGSFGGAENGAEILGLQLQYFLKPYNGTETPDAEDEVREK